jgi:uncharacterized membrane protein
MSGELLTEYTEVDNNLYQFNHQWSTNFFSTNYSVSITLPQGSSIDSDSDGIIIPKNTSFSSDGNRITINWNNLDYNSSLEDDEVIIQFLYAPEIIQEGDENISTGGFIIAVLLGLSIGASIVYLYFRYKIEDIESQSKIETKVVEKVRPVLLSPNEIEVLKLINENDGGIKQADLVTLLNVTKARVSQYLTKLEELGFIKKSKMGRQNFIILEQHIVLDFEAEDIGSE